MNAVRSHSGLVKITQTENRTEVTRAGDVVWNRDGSAGCRVPETDAGEGCTMTGRCAVPLTRIPCNGHGAEFYVRYILPQ